MLQKKNIFLYIFFIMALLTLPSYAEDKTFEDEKVIVKLEGTFETLATDVLKSYAGILTELAGDLGWQTDFRPEIILVNSNSFKKAAGSDLVMAFAVPREDLIIIDSSKMNEYPFTFRATLKHELCHLKLHHHIAQDILPRWIDEGICQWVSGGLSEVMADGNRTVLKEAILSKRLMSIKQLAEGFPSDGRAMILAYEESRSIIEYTEKEFGSSGVRRILENMSKGDSLEDAVQKSISISLDELEKRWKSSLINRTSWVSYVGDNIYEILFVLGALMAIYGFIVILKKKKEYKDRDEDEESGRPTADENAKDS
jgi:hypothetical protein